MAQPELNPVALEHRLTLIEGALNSVVNTLTTLVQEVKTANGRTASAEHAIFLIQEKQGRELIWTQAQFDEVKVAARVAGRSIRRLRKSRLVVTPNTTVSSSATCKRSSAPSRVGALLGDKFARAT